MELFIVVMDIDRIHHRVNTHKYSSVMGKPDLWLSLYRGLPLLKPFQIHLKRCLKQSEHEVLLFASYYEVGEKYTISC